MTQRKLTPTDDPNDQILSRTVSRYDERSTAVARAGILVLAGGAHHIVGDEAFVAALVRRRRPDETAAPPADRVGDVFDIGHLQLVGTGLGIGRGAPPHDTEGGAQTIGLREQIRVGVDPSGRVTTVGLELQQHNVVRQVIVDPVKSLGVLGMEEDFFDVDPLDVGFVLVVQTRMLADDDVGRGGIVVGAVSRRQDGVGGDERAAAVRPALLVVDVSHVLISLEFGILSAKDSVGICFIAHADVDNVCVCCLTFSSGG